MVQVAILGFGTVGSGVAEVLTAHEESIAKKLDDRIHLKYILVRSRRESPFAARFVEDFSVIENDPEVDIVVETIGGVTDARDYTMRALKAGKSVVTANKELVATHGYELLRLAKQHKVSYLFEASVGGGIPILRPISQCLAANELSEVCGILNGTTNYILTRMLRAGLSFEAALQEAQDKGYAERDPSADVEGHDACRKICILAALAFGRHVYPHQVSTEGITSITQIDADLAANAGKTIKLLGRAVREETSGKLRIYVAPHLVDRSDPLSGVEDVFNAIKVRGDAIGEVMFYGRGAGKLPTASAVVADVIDAAKHLNTRKYLDWDEGGEDVTAPADELPCRWYVRAQGDGAALCAALGGGELICGASGAADASACITTAAMTYAQVKQRLVNVELCSLLRVLD